MALSAIRTVLIYIFIVTAMRIMGKRQLGEMQPAELVVTLMISDLASIPMQENGMPLLSGLIPILILISFEIILSAIMLKVPAFHRLISGKPKIIVDNGHVDMKALKDLRMTADDLMETLRQQGTFDLREVQYAIVEANGKISVLLHPGNRPATCNDMQVESLDNGMPMIIINDGKISDWGLRVCELDMKWLHSVLKKNHCEVKDVFIMTADKKKSYAITKKEKSA